MTTENEEITRLSLDELSIPPWEEPSTGSSLVEATGFDSKATTEPLEIYRKAANFNKLSLVSGNTIGCSVDEYVKKNYGKEGMRRLAVARHLLKALGFVPHDDVLLMLACTKKARSIIATAGAGKTTSLQLDLIVSKMLDTVLHCYNLDPVRVEGTDVEFPSILYLNYNKHNVQPIFEKHRSLCALANSAMQETIRDDIESSTVHAFCHRWLQAFSFDVDVPPLKVIDNDKKRDVWNAVAAPRWKKFYEEEEMTVSWETLEELYTFKVESMLDWDQFFMTSKFIDTELYPEFVQACIKKYDSLKKSMKLMDFTDYLLLTIEILKNNEELRLKVQQRYKIIVADENQDFTALMNELLLQLYNPEYNRLIVVGDPDQTIYAFKGVSPDNVVGLVDRLEDVELLGLDTNYRCPDKIVDCAKAILDMNVLRFKKPIETVKTGGKVVMHPLASKGAQANEVLRILKSNGPIAYDHTVITYRNNNSSIIIGEELYYANIPFSVLDDRRPFQNMVFKHIQTALEALKVKDDADLNKTLYRFLPLSKEAWGQIVTANAKKRRHHLDDYVLPNELPKGTMKALEILRYISTIIDKAPCSDYVNTLLYLYQLYYYEFLMRNPNPSIGDEDYYALMFDRSKKFWTRPYTYDYMCQELLERNVDRPNAVTLSTFHGLKGLEFDYVIAVDFNDNIFPNFFGIEQRYPLNTAMEEKESENRLCYVLVTRAVKELHLLYMENNPSVYTSVISAAYAGTSAERAEEATETVNLGTISMPSDANNAKLSFIQRLTGNRRK